jgi:hypothetical protein
MALVLQMDTGLFGFHIPPGHKGRTPAFAQFCRQHRAFGTMKHLYGSCYWDNRYATEINKFPAWIAEMRELGRHLGYVGTVSGFNTAAAQTNIALVDATYLEYRRAMVAHTCTIHYLDMKRVTVTKQGVPNTEVRRLNDGGQETVPYQSKVVTDVQPAAGNFTDVTDAFGFYSFSG